MKVTSKQRLTTAAGNHKPGDVVELPDEHAKVLAHVGVVEIVKDKAADKKAADSTGKG